jgi:hypothetical protein
MESARDESVKSNRANPWKDFARYHVPLIPFSKLLGDRSACAAELYAALFAVASRQGLLIGASPYRKRVADHPPRIAASAAH